MARGLLRLSLNAQVLALVLGAALAAQACTIAVVLLAPPDPFSRYSESEIVAALQNRGFPANAQRPLRHRVLRTLPETLAHGDEHKRMAAQLAIALGVPADAVRVYRPKASALDFIRPQGSARSDDLYFRGDFTVAWHSGENRWVVVETVPALHWLSIQLVIRWLLGGIVVVAPIGYWFARRISAPIKGFAKSAEAIGRDPQARMLAPSGPAEIGVAAAALNAMQARVQRYVADRVGMVGAISHDLRTPLTRIRFKLENVDQAVRASVLKDIGHMEHMIDSVVAFSQDFADAPIRQRLDLSSLVISVADDATGTGAEVRVHFDQPVIVNGDPIALQRLFSNLIDNAVKYGRSAEIGIVEDHNFAVVTIADQGSGIAAGEMEKVFMPFYRADAHQRADIPGVGLGLAIARSVARGHGGDIVLRSTDDGLVAEVVIPLASRALVDTFGT